MGMEGHLVNVEVDIADGLPNYSLLGLPDAALNESRDRVRSAMVNSHEPWPNRKVTVSLSPAWLPKSGSGFDVPIAVALLAAQALVPSERIHGTVFLGELGLDGSVRGIRGVLPSLISAHKQGVERAVVPYANRIEAALISEMEIVAVRTLVELLHWLRTDERQTALDLDFVEDEPEEDLDFIDVAGQVTARWRGEVGAVGGHHMLLIGPPGAGKTMIAQRLPGILPALSREEVLEVSAIHSLSSGRSVRSPLSSRPPFVAPHHTATRVAMVGGRSASNSTWCMFFGTCWSSLY
ncbi:MAG: magnesium chelatase domain-containing protein [Actinomycetota bacterium]